MEIIRVNDQNIGEFIKFSKSVYVGNPYFRDNMSKTAAEILNNKAEICKGSYVEGVMVKSNNTTLAVCFFCIVDRMSDILQMCWFESLDDNEAIGCLIEYGKKMAVRFHIKKILVGLNMHVNYGLGILDSHFDEPQSLGSAYNPPYYNARLRQIASEEIKLVSYLVRTDQFDFNVGERFESRVLSKYSVRRSNFKQLEKEAAIYTDINNRAFAHHRFYYERRINEDLELFQDFRFLLKEENLLFLLHEGKEIGFMLWYPDFNQLLKPGESIGIKTVIKSKLFPSKINRFKIVEVGVVPEFQKTGAIFALFHACRRLTGNKYEWCESGWILDDNYPSKNFGIRWADKEYKQYSVFLIDV